MEIVSNLDRVHAHPNNEEMGKLAGKRVRDWRLSQQPAMNQDDFARAAKVSLGCLQSFERGVRATRDKNVTKIARVMGLTKDQLMSEDWPEHKPNPLLKDLRTEDLRVANQFHHDSADAKHAIKLFFEGADEMRERVARIVDAVLRSPNLLAHFEWFLEDEDEWDQLTTPAKRERSKKS